MSPAQKSLDGMELSLFMNNIKGMWSGNLLKEFESHLVIEDQHINGSNTAGKDVIFKGSDVTYTGSQHMTIEKWRKGSKYLYAVYNNSEYQLTKGKYFSDTPLSVSVTKRFSPEKIFLRYFFPLANQEGNGWIVFGIGEGGEFYEINQFIDVTTREQFDDALNKFISEDYWETRQAHPIDYKYVDMQNKYGESAYHKKDYKNAVECFKNAISVNPKFIEAYSNLGLALQKLNRFPEALWANSEAISLANANDEKHIRASSYFNIARIYEQKGKWAQALRAFKNAEEQKGNETYRKGIERMRKKIGK